ncbi:MAG: ATP-dependent Clp protease ATP-binding subunit [Eubacteriales bacterium]|nr:ATP-dependent Clp protease ATP-binding subunit [Eubacteriales bacterium]
MPTKSTNVMETIKQAAVYAVSNKRREITPNDLMVAIVNREEFKNAFSRLYDKEKYDKFSKDVSDLALKIPADPEFDPTPSEVKSDAFTVQIFNTLSRKAFEMTQKLFGDYSIRLSALFMGTCISTPDYSYDKIMLSNGISKDDIYYELLMDELSGTALKIDKNSLKIRDFYLAQDEPPRTNVRTLGTFISAAASSKRSSVKLASLDCGFLVDLLKKAESYNKPFIGREDVIQRTIQVLCRCEKANPLHVGEPGVGKTAVTYGLAKRILENKVPDQLKNASLYELNLTKLGAGASIMGEYEQRVISVFEELKKVENPIIFIDEIHTVFSSSTSSTHDLGSTLKPYLLDPKFKFIGATTYSEYNKYIKDDPAFERRFLKIDLAEPSLDQAKDIIRGLLKKYEDYHHVTYLPDAVDEAVELSAKHIHSRFLPDKAIDLIDEAGASKELNEDGDKIVTVEDIKDQLNKTCGIPVEALKNEKEIVKTLDVELKKNVFGQDEAIKKITTMLQIAKAGLGDDEKPIGSFLFVGPSGVGKTELAKVLAKILGIDFIRFDMSEYAEPHSVSKLFGAPAGYVGYDDGGLLTKEVQKKPHSVILLDEIEKAHPEIFKTFLQVLDYGTLTDSKGVKTDFRNSVIVFTSNAGAADSARQCIGFGAGTNRSAIMDAICSTFAPEFRNRLSGIVEFNGLNEDTSNLIANKELNKLCAKVKKQGYEMKVSDDCIKEIAKRGVSDEYGAREIGRVIDTEIRQMLSSEIINGTLDTVFTLDYRDGRFIIESEIEDIDTTSVVNISYTGEKSEKI